MVDRQLELGLANGRGSYSPNRPQSRQNRARWWFDRMRQTVDRALVWQPVPPARPEQTWLPNALRLGPSNPAPEPAVSTTAGAAQQRQMPA